MISGTEIFFAVACGVAVGSLIGSIGREALRYFAERRSLAAMRAQMKEVNAITERQRDSAAAMLLRMKSAGLSSHMDS